jgi:hypothetical protein
MELLEKAVHRGNDEAPAEESTPASVLDALDWSEDDSAKELVEKAGTVADSVDGDQGPEDD